MPECLWPNANGMPAMQSANQDGGNLLMDYAELVKEMHKIAEGTDPYNSIFDEAADAITTLQAERDAAFKMSKCECSPDECCANLVKAWAERDALQEQLQKWNEAADRARQPLEFYKKYDEGAMRAMQAMKARAETERDSLREKLVTAQALLQNLRSLVPEDYRHFIDAALKDAK